MEVQSALAETGSSAVAHGRINKPMGSLPHFPMYTGIPMYTIYHGYTYYVYL